MSSFAHTSSASSMTMDMAPMGVFVPTTPLVVRREKRRRRRQDEENTNDSKNRSKRHAVRHGFVFDATTHDESMLQSASQTSASQSQTSTFVFRVRKETKPHTKTKTSAAPPSSSANGVDAANATAALLKKKEREQKRVRLQKRKAAMEQEERFEAALVEDHKLSRDQVQLYYAVRDHVKREMRKTMRDFARSAARADILQLTEKSLGAIKGGITEFMTENPPSQTMVTLANPENERLRALIESYETRINELSSEEAAWNEMKSSINSATAEIVETEEETKESETETATEERAQPSVVCELSVTREIESMQRAAVEHVEISARRLQVVQDSMASIDRLALQAEIKKSQLFDAFHGSAFKGYVQDSKEALRTLLRLK